MGWRGGREYQAAQDWKSTRLNSSHTVISYAVFCLKKTIARNISDSILTSVLKFGDHVPSVRQASSSRGVSASTVFKAYYLLDVFVMIAAPARLSSFPLPSPLRI